MAEEALQQELLAAFPFLQGALRAPRARRVFADMPADKASDAIAYLAGKGGFHVLCAITGLDLGESLGALYHLARENGTVLTLSVAVPKTAPVLKTVTHLYPAADCYERELVDLLGFRIDGLGEGNRYPLPDGWPAGQYPLRKDWKAEGLEAINDMYKESGNA